MKKIRNRAGKDSTMRSAYKVLIRRGDQTLVSLYAPYFTASGRSEFVTVYSATPTPPNVICFVCTTLKDAMQVLENHSNLPGVEVWKCWGNIRQRYFVDARGLTGHPILLPDRNKSRWMAQLYSQELGLDYSPECRFMTDVTLERRIL